MKLVIISVVLVGVAFLLLGIKVLFVKGGKFPSGHIHHSAAMRARGISCASAEDKAQRDKRKNNI